MRLPALNFARQFSIMASKGDIKVEPYSMAFVTAPNKDVAKSLAGGLGKYNFSDMHLHISLYASHNFEGTCGTCMYSAFHLKVHFCYVPEMEPRR